MNSSLSSDNVSMDFDRESQLIKSCCTSNAGSITLFADSSAIVFSCQRGFSSEVSLTFLLIFLLEECPYSLQLMQPGLKNICVSHTGGSMHHVLVRKTSQDNPDMCVT